MINNKKQFINSKFKEKFMRKIFVILISLSMLTFISCSSNTLPPTLKVTNNTSEIATIKGNYDWLAKNSMLKKESFRSEPESPMEIAENMEGTKVSPLSELNLEFNKKPKTVTVTALGESKNNQYTYEDNKIIVPKEEGTYIYEISAEWKQGHISYIIKFIVSEK